MNHVSIIKSFLACQDFAILLLIGPCLVLSILLLSFPIFLLSSSFVESLFVIFDSLPSDFQKHWLAKSFRCPYSNPIKQIQKLSAIMNKPTAINPPAALLAYPCLVFSLLFFVLKAT